VVWFVQMIRDLDTLNNKWLRIQSPTFKYEKNTIVKRRFILYTQQIFHRRLINKKQKWIFSINKMCSSNGFSFNTLTWLQEKSFVSIIIYDLRNTNLWLNTTYQFTILPLNYTTRASPTPHSNLVWTTYSVSKQRNT
jgi:hypothetical protein